MDARRFDAITRTFSVLTSRRGALAALLTALGTPFLPAADVMARRRKGRGKNKRQRDKEKESRKRERKRQRRKQQRQRTRAEAAAGCCTSGNCSPGQGKNLTRCCFEGQNLVGKNFKSSNLTEANFRGANLTNAKFQSSNLTRACLVDATITGAKFKSANQSGVIRCRTITESGEDNSGCDRGTPCCPTCDDQHPCGPGQLCCEGRCVTGECCGESVQSTCGSGELCCSHTCVAGVCCRAADCANEICQQRACTGNQCDYTPVFGESGPACQGLCCRDDQGQPECCDAEVSACTASGLCRCRDNEDCAADEVCCDGSCEDPIWAIETAFGRMGDGDAEFSFPLGIAISGDEETAFVVDQRHNRVSMWRKQTDGSWDHVRNFGSEGEAADQFSNPFGVAVSDDGQTVWVADQGNDRISVWSLASGSPRPLTQFHVEGLEPGQRSVPTGVAIFEDGATIWVSESASNRVSVWVRQTATSWTKQTTFGSGVFRDPVGLAVSGDGNTVWVTDRLANEGIVSVWERQSDDSWDRIAAFGDFGDRADQLRGPTAVVASADGQTAWVGDLGGADRISVWVKQADGSWAHLFNFAGGGAIGGPQNMALSGDERTLWVSESGGNRVSVWSLTGCPAS